MGDSLIYLELAFILNEKVDKVPEFSPDKIKKLREIKFKGDYLNLQFRGIPFDQKLFTSLTRSLYQKENGAPFKKIGFQIK